jgi:DNA-binding transcriptional ArsR family regulator
MGCTNFASRLLQAPGSQGSWVAVESRNAPVKIYLTMWLTIIVPRSIFNHMVSQHSPSLDRVFHALADPTRRAMLRALASRERNIGELATPFDMSFAAASKHVRVLEAAGLLRRKVEGRSHVCRIEPSPLAAADKWLRFYQHFWSKRLDALDALLKAENAAVGSPSSRQGRHGDQD